MPAPCANKTHWKYVFSRETFFYLGHNYTVSKYEMKFEENNFKIDQSQRPFFVAYFTFFRVFKISF